MSEPEDDELELEDDADDEGEEPEEDVDAELLEPEKKRTRATRERGVEIGRRAMQLMAAGLSGRRLDEQLASAFTLSERQARRYRIKVERELKVSGASPMSEMVLLAFQQAIKGGKISAAVSAVNALAKLKPADPTTLKLYQELGPPPKDPLEAVEYTMKSLIIQQREIMLDSSLEPARRRAELRANARAVLACVPREKLKKAHDVVKSFAEGKADPTKSRETEHVENEPGGSLRADARRGARFRGRPPG